MLKTSEAVATWVAQENGVIAHATHPMKQKFTVCGLRMGRKWGIALYALPKCPDCKAIKKAKSRGRSRARAQLKHGSKYGYLHQ